MSKSQPFQIQFPLSADQVEYLNSMLRELYQQSAAGGGLTEVNDTDVQFTDNTTGNASTTKHGYLPKLSGAATDFLNGTGVFSVPAGAVSVAQVALRAILGV